LDLKLLNRLITNFDEVPPYLSSAIHIADEDGVTIFKTCTTEVFRRHPKHENRSVQVFETRKDSAVHVSLSSSSLVKQPGAQPLLLKQEAIEDPTRRRMTTGLHRLLIHSSKVRSFTDTTAVLAESQDSAALSGTGYKPARSSLSTPIVNKSSHPFRLFSRRLPPGF